MLLCYNPLWQRLGLEVVYGEVISLDTSVNALNLSRFIMQRLLANPDIAARHAHPTVPHSYAPGKCRSCDAPCHTRMRKFVPFSLCCHVLFYQTLPFPLSRPISFVTPSFLRPTPPSVAAGYYQALGQFALKKFLLLVMFLDAAKRQRLINEDPCLFCYDAEFKVSAVIMVTFKVSTVVTLTFKVSAAVQGQFHTHGDLQGQFYGRGDLHVGL